MEKIVYGPTAAMQAEYGATGHGEYPFVVMAIGDETWDECLHHTLSDAKTDAAEWAALENVPFHGV